jgi:hypothetical protein
MASRIGPTSIESYRLVLLTATAYGSLSAVTSRWYLVPTLPWPTGFGRVNSRRGRGGACRLAPASYRRVLIDAGEPFGDEGVGEIDLLVE